MRYKIYSQIIKHACYKVYICKGKNAVYTFDCMRPPKDLAKELEETLPKRALSAVLRDFLNSANTMCVFYKKDFK